MRRLPRREFSRGQKVAMIKRAIDESGLVRCEGCGLNITGKVIEFDHVIPEALILDKDRPLDVEDGRVLGRDCCHRAPGTKTAADLAVIAEAKRREARHLGIRRLSSRGFVRSPPQRPASRPLAKPAAWRRDDD
ncbi:hypothetical protein [Bosea sp. NBC_00550]|uniref:hypothetical protein n=1 Tax=Bosea sp. NBC_00550 TaxID=2969621 RepID=UPI00222FBEB7|nr:hypothetical protein [Bosea sp. NBC_00550]UZF91316.1 hypothetical protein NWE53_19635 [Bosea sp. NBC_00550]